MLIKINYVVDVFKEFQENLFIIYKSFFHFYISISNSQKNHNQVYRWLVNLTLLI
jgi:hypothetical protein